MGFENVQRQLRHNYNKSSRGIKQVKPQRDRRPSARIDRPPEVQTGEKSRQHDLCPASHRAPDFDTATSR